MRRLAAVLAAAVLAGALPLGAHAASKKAVLDARIQAQQAKLHDEYSQLQKKRAE